jgi:hypothetical protein
MWCTDTVDSPGVGINPKDTGNAHPAIASVWRHILRIFSLQVFRLGTLMLLYLRRRISLSAGRDARRGRWLIISRTGDIDRRMICHLQFCEEMMLLSTNGRIYGVG